MQKQNRSAKIEDLIQSVNQYGGIYICCICATTKEYTTVSAAKIKVLSAQQFSVEPNVIF